MPARMIVRRGGPRRVGADYWPGFVDVMATLLLVIIFLLSVFMLAQFFLAQAVSGRDAALDRLRSQVSELQSLLALEKKAGDDLREQLQALGDVTGPGSQVETLEQALEEEKLVSEAARAEVGLLSQQIAALKRQLARLNDALEASEEKERQSQAQIVNLGRRLNAALALKVQELARYRSEFFGALRSILGNRQGVRVEGDRFVLQSEVLFESGSADINLAGRDELQILSSALLQIAGEIPPEIDWVLRVDGHTDVIPIETPRYPSNWYLSAARAIAVVEALVSYGVPADRLVAAGFGEFRPLNPGGDSAALRENRRIEFKLTGR